MLSDILTAWQTTKMPKDTFPKFTCQYCNREFKRENTLAAHLCEKKRRWQQEKEPGIQLGFKSYLRFFETTQGGKNKTYADFVDSGYYSAFVKFGHYCRGIKCLNVASYVDWLLKNNKKLDYWTKEEFYSEWIFQYIRKESVQDALERGLTTMQEYADEHPELKNGFTDYFRYGNSYRISYHITTSRISPWVIFNCATGIEFLETLTEEQVSIVMPYIDPEFWQRKFKDHAADTLWVKEILKTAGL
jgi:hypothetical protein